MSITQGSLGIIKFLCRLGNCLLLCLQVSAHVINCLLSTFLSDLGLVQCAFGTRQLGCGVVQCCLSLVEGSLSVVGYCFIISLLIVLGILKGLLSLVICALSVIGGCLLCWLILLSVVQFNNYVSIERNCIWIISKILIALISFKKYKVGISVLVKAKS